MSRAGSTGRPGAVGAGCSLRRRLFVTGGLGWLASRAVRARAGASRPPLVLAVHPYLTQAEILRRFTPLAEFIGGALGAAVAVRVGGSYAEHIAAIGRDEVDIAFLGPLGYVGMLERFGPKPFLARFEVNHQPNLYGVIAVAQHSRVKSVADLRGCRFAFGDPDSTMSYVVPAWFMAQQGVPLGALAGHRFLGSHPSIALGILAGDYDAGALKREVYDQYAPRGLRILAQLPPTPDHLFVTRANFPADRVLALRGSLLTLHEAAQGPAILDQLHPGLTRLIEGSAADYRALGDMMRSLEAATRRAG